MTIWFTSDTHFGHKNIIKYSGRPFKSVEEMDESMIKRWNSVVSEGDTVYHLGDVAFYRDAHAISLLLGRLKGYKHMLVGNHDEKRPAAKFGNSVWHSVSHYKRIKIDGQRIVLCHYPLASWHGMHKGAWHLHGHCHGNLRCCCHKSGCRTLDNMKRIDVGVDRFDYTPVSFDTIKEAMDKRVFEPVDHHGRGR